MNRFGWKQWAALAALVFVILITGLFAMRTVRRAIYWRMHRDEVIRPWMSIPYVAHSYRVPPYILYDALSIPPQPHDRRPIREIAREQNKPVDQIIALLQSAIAQERATRPPNGQPPLPGSSP